MGGRFGEKTAAAEAVGNVATQICRSMDSCIGNRGPGILIDSIFGRVCIVPEARHASQSSPQGADLTVFLEPETQRVWRLFCFASTEVVDNKVARICEQVRDGLRPLKNQYARE